MSNKKITRSLEVNIYAVDSIDGEMMLTCKDARLHNYMSSDYVKIDSQTINVRYDGDEVDELLKSGKIAELKKERQKHLADIEQIDQEIASMLAIEFKG
jgi:hypothetical protein